MKLFLKDANDVKLNSPDEVKKITNSFIVSVIILLLILDMVSALIFNKIDYFYIFIDFLFIIGFFTKIINKN